MLIRVENKNLLKYNKPMKFYPMRNLKLIMTRILILIKIMRILKVHRLNPNQIKQTLAISTILIELTKVIALTITTIPILLLSHTRINLTKNKNIIKQIITTNREGQNNKKCKNKKEGKTELDKHMSNIKDKKEENSNKCIGMKRCNKEKREIKSSI